MRYAAGWSFFLLSPCKMYVWLLSKKTENRIFKGEDEGREGEGAAADGKIK